MTRVFVVGALALTAACGGHVLDLGNDAPDPTTPDSRDAGSGVLSVVIGHQIGAVALALDNKRVYWSTGPDFNRPPNEDPAELGVVRSCEKENCAATVITYATSQYTNKILVGKSRVYWIGEKDVVACPVEGCAGPPASVVLGRVAFALDDSHIYSYMPDYKGLQSTSLEDGAMTTLAGRDDVFPGGLFAMDTLAVDGVFLYWVVPGPLGAVMRVRKDGTGSAEAIIPGLHQPTSIAVGPTDIFWTEQSTVGAILSCPLNGCIGEPVVIASHQSFPSLLARTDDRLYWFATSDGWPALSDEHTRGNLFECAPTGCGSSPGLLVTEVDWPRAVAADATHVYWTSVGPEKSSDPHFYTDGAVKRIMWPPR